MRIFMVQGEAARIVLHVRTLATHVSAFVELTTREGTRRNPQACVPAERHVACDSHGKHVHVRSTTHAPIADSLRGM